MGSWVVDIKDFQSLRNAKIELITGLTIIQGKTNVGKSAVFRAIDAALFNMGDDSMVRGGKRYSGVSIDNGTHKMVFCRDAKGKNEKTAYQFDDGTVQKKVGRSQLPEVAQMFNIRYVRMQNGTKMKINFWYQNDKPFLMDKTSGQLYEFLSLSSCDKYSKILKLMVSDLKVQEADINNITTEIDTLKVVNNRKLDFISKNQGFDDLYVQVMVADQQSRSLNSIEQIFKRIEYISDKIKSCESRLKSVTNRFNSIPIQYLDEIFRSVSTGHTESMSLYQDLMRISDLNKKIEKIENSLSKVTLDYERVVNLEKETSDRVNDIYDRSKGIQIIERILTVCNGAEIKIKSVSETIYRLDKKVYADETLLKDKIQNVEAEDRYCRDLKVVMDRITDLNSKISVKVDCMRSVDERMKETDEELKELKKLAGYCPFCGTVFEEVGGHTCQ